MTYFVFLTCGITQDTAAGTFTAPVNFYNRPVFSRTGLAFHTKEWTAYGYIRVWIIAWKISFHAVSLLCYPFKHLVPQRHHLHLPKGIVKGTEGIEPSFCILWSPAKRSLTPSPFAPDHTDRCPVELMPAHRHGTFGASHQRRYPNW